MQLVSGKLVSGHSISEPNGPPGPGIILRFLVHGRKGKIHIDQSLILESSTNLYGFDMIKEVSLEIGGNVIETHSGQLLQDLSAGRSQDLSAGRSQDLSAGRSQYIIPLHFFYCRSKTPLVLDALDYNEVSVLVKLGNYDITRCELDSTMVTAPCIRHPGVTKITIITEKYPDTEYEDFIVVDDKVYYLVHKRVQYNTGRWVPLS